MKKNKAIPKTLVFMSLLLCVFSLSGCSAAMQSLSDASDVVLNALTGGADMVINGLAGGADRVISGLADGADLALESLSEADDGQIKDTVLNAYGALVDKAGAAALTPEGDLEGELTKGPDDYTGSYHAAYSDFTGTELLFGGTTLEREGGGTLRISCSLSLDNGEAAIFLCSGAGDPVILLSESGEITSTVEVDGASTYIGVWGSHADGTVTIEVKQGSSL